MRWARAIDGLFADLLKWARANDEISGKKGIHLPAEGIAPIRAYMK
ncbi:MAG TPA: hypothetical protein VNO70_18400 [Blastocatellia bacterium]|nr:hypothetical protein [Blastocatellia bacterium]